MLERRFCVYKHTNKYNNKCYIGITSQDPPEKRWGNDGILYKDQMFGFAIRKYGWNNFDHEILYRGLSNQEALDIEAELIAYYKSRDMSYNVSDGYDLGTYVSKRICVYTLNGEYLGTYDSIHEAGTIYNVSDSYIGECASLRRKLTHVKDYIFLWENDSIDERLKVLTYNVHKGHPCSDENKAKLSARMKNRIVSDATRLKQSTRLKGVIPPHVLQYMVKVDMLDDDDNVIKSFDSLADAARYIGVKSAGKISLCCRGERMHCGGYKWKFSNNQ